MFRSTPSLVILLALFALATQVLAAPVMYQYQGPHFDFSSGNGPVEGLTNISGYFVLPDAIGPNSLFHAEADRPDLDAAPIALSFTDGVTTIGSLSELLDWGFWIETDGTGALSGWQVALSMTGTGPPGTFSNLNVDYLFPPTTYDQSIYCVRNDCNSIGVARINTTATNRGTWTISSVPTPPAVYLFGSALGVIGWMRRKHETN